MNTALTHDNKLQVYRQMMSAWWLTVHVLFGSGSSRQVFGMADRQTDRQTDR